MAWRKSYEKTLSISNRHPIFYAKLRQFFLVVRRKSRAM